MSEKAYFSSETDKGSFSVNGSSINLLDLSRRLVSDSKNELISEIKSSIDDLLNKKTLQIMMLCKNKAAERIEADRIKNTPGWFESLSQDVTQDEYLKYLGVPPPLDSNNSKKNTTTFKEEENIPKPLFSKGVSKELPSFFDLLNGTVSDSTSKKEYSFTKSQPKAPFFMNFSTFSTTSIPQSNTSSLNNDTPLQKPPSSDSSLKQASYKSKRALELEKTRSTFSKMCVGLARLRYLIKESKEYEETDIMKTSLLEIIRTCLENTFSITTDGLELQAALKAFNFKGHSHLIFALDEFSNIITKSVSLISYKQKFLKSLSIIPGHDAFENYRKQFSCILLLSLFSYCPYILPLTEKSDMHEPPKDLTSGNSPGPSLETKMINIFGFYCLLILENSEGPNNVFTISSAWDWVSSFPLAKKSSTNAGCLFVLIEILGQKLISTYQDQAVKLFRFILSEVLKAPHSVETQKLRSSLNSILAAPYLSKSSLD